MHLTIPKSLNSTWSKKKKKEKKTLNSKYPSKIQNEK